MRQAEFTPNRHAALLVDEESRWVRRPRDLVAAVLTLLAIAVVMVIAVYGYSTTLAVTRDIRIATNGLVEKILFMPVNVLEGLVGFFLPAVLILDMTWHRRWRTVATTFIAVGSSIGIAYALLWLFTRYFPLSPITGQLFDSLTEQSYFKLLPYVAIVSAVITVASSGQATRVTRSGWPMLAIVLVLSVLQGNQTLPGALITVFVGVLCGQLSRYAMGDVPDRATGGDLVRLIRKAGVDAELVVRIDSLPDDAPLHAWVVTTNARLGYVDRYGIEQIRTILMKAGETLEGSGTEEEASAQPVINSLPYTSVVPTDSSSITPAPDVDIATLVRDTINEFHPPLSEEASRNYLVIDSSGDAFHASLFDADRQIVGALQSTWDRIVLTTTARHSESTIEGSANKFVLMELATASAGLTPDHHPLTAGTENSQLVMLQVNGSTAFNRLTPEQIPDEALDEVWEILQRAHRQGISHGDIRAGSVALRDGHTEILHWENGRLTSTEMERRIDMAQAMAMMTTSVGMDRAVASASRCLPRDQVVSLAPVLQKAIIPGETTARFTDKKQLERLRDALTEQVPEVAEISPTQLYRFSPKMVVTVTIGLLAVYILLGSVNFEELKETLANANPAWMVFAFLVGLVTYLGAAMTLRAYTAEKISLRESALVQVAASLVTLVAPAGIGPAALNLRFLQKRRVSTPIALATVSLVQVAQFLTTIIVLILLSLATGEVGSLSIPSASVIVAILVAIAAIAALFLIRPLRRWLAKKIRPTIDQIWPRLVWLATHPSRIAYGFLGSMVQTIAFVACFGGALAAFGYNLPVVTLAVTYLVSNSVGSVVPSPGGIGPVEAALTGGLTLAGVPASIALSTAVLYRLFTFWGRVPLGWLALRYLTKHEII